MGAALIVVLLAMWWFISSARSPQTEDSSGSEGRQGPDDREQDEIKSDPAGLDVNQSTSSPSNDPPKQGHDEQATTLAAAGLQNDQDDDLHESAQNLTDSNGFFNSSHDLFFYRPVMNNIKETKEKVLQWLAKLTMSGAEFDASGHVPGCHPGTRIAILDSLQHWINDTQNIRQMLWLRGPAGVGKSAILQSLAEQLSEASKLGATLFFSRPNKRDNPIFVIPTIAYQLAVRIPSYKEYLRQIMINNPKLLEKDMERQFKAFIVEPFIKLKLTTEGAKWAILLDGLDECYGEDAQMLIVRLISRFTRQYPTAPLIWVIASRPEAHLQLVFSSVEVSGSFEEHEVLANSDDACRDVEKVLRAKFEEIRQNYRDLMPAGAPWPAERDITRISKTSSGLFALAMAVARYVEDPHVCDPISQLAAVLSVTDGLEPGSLSALHAFYSTILGGVPKSMSPILKLVLAFYAIRKQGTVGLTDDDIITNYSPLVVVATIFGLQQHTVYGALRKLHSVIKVPSLDESGHREIRFYHASFSDYLKTLGEYDLDGETVTKMWCGYFRILHGGDSTAYRDSISGGRPPVPLSWDAKLANRTAEGLWGDGLQSLLHLLLPKCTNFNVESVHSHPSFNVGELQSIFEKMDFSALIFKEDHEIIFPQLLDLFRWFINAAPPELSQSDTVKKIPLGNLDFACVPEEKLAHELKWNRGKHPARYEAVSPDGTTLSWSANHYCTTSSQDPHEDWLNPMEELAPQLSKLRSDRPTIDVVLVGKRPSRRCVLICTEPTDEEWGLLYCIPYCQ